jgi:hypothetical protein
VPLKATPNPDPSPLTGPQMTVAALACEFTLRHLKAHGTDPGYTQSLALSALQRVLVEQAFGLTPRRVVCGLPAGYGKTSAVAGLICALHALRTRFPTEITVLVAAEKVEALCTLKRDILELAEREGHAQGLSERIGLVHSYGTNASEPSTPDSDLRPYVLATHARMSDRRGSIKALNVFRQGNHERPRDLVVWDERLEVGSVIAFDYRVLSGNLAAAIDGLETGDPSIAEACLWAKEAKATINGAAALNPVEGAVITLPAMDEERRIRIAQALSCVVGGEVIRNLLPMAGGMVRVNPRKNASGCTGGVVKFIASIPDEVRRLVVLDASAEVSRLYAADNRIIDWTALPGMRSLTREQDFARLKDYSSVEIRFMQRGGGYASVQDDAAKDRSLIGDIVEVLKAVPEGEAALTFTYKLRNRKGDIDLTEAIQAAMRKAGLDPDQKVEVAGGTRERFPIATWGQETNSNEWVHCTQVLLPGVMRLPFGEVFGQFLAARDDLSAPYPKRVEDDVVRGQLAGAVYQAASRGSCRSTTEDGKARPMTLWLVDKDDGLRTEIDRLMPGARWTEWDGAYRKAKSSAKPRAETETDRAFLSVLRYLQARPAAVTSVSTKRLWPKVDPSEEVSRDVRLAAIERFHSATDGWVREGRSLVRVEAVEAVRTAEAASMFRVELSRDEQIAQATQF